MTVYPAAAVFLLIWLIASLRSADNGVPLAVAVLPFGMFAALVAGGLSIILANLLAILTLGLLIMRALSNQSRLDPLRLPRSATYILIFAGYSIFSAVVLVRLFQGQFLVFPMSVTSKGVQTSTFFLSTMWPLTPTNSNIAQAVYVTLSSLFFVAALLVMRRRGLAFGEKGLAWAAGLNALLGLLDFLGLDALLSFVRTADYSLLNSASVGGFARVIGGFSEASGFGTASAGFFAYFAMSFLIERRGRDAMLALASLACAILSLSSTGIIALVAAILLILVHARTYLGAGLRRAFGHFVVIGLACLSLAVCVFVLTTPATELTTKTLDQLIFSKASSSSGIERGAWSRAGYDAFLQTWGLGAGVGSLRANGTASVLLGSVGLPGTIAFLGFLFHAVVKPLGRADQEARRAFYAGRVCLLTLLASMLVSATTPDPTLFLAFVASIAVASRERGWAPATEHVEELETDGLPGRI